MIEVVALDQAMLDIRGGKLDMDFVRDAGLADAGPASEKQRFAPIDHLEQGNAIRRRGGGVTKRQGSDKGVCDPNPATSIPAQIPDQRLAGSEKPLRALGSDSHGFVAFDMPRFGAWSEPCGQLSTRPTLKCCSNER